MDIISFQLDVFLLVQLFCTSLYNLRVKNYRVSLIVSSTRRSSVEELKVEGFFLLIITSQSFAFIALPLSAWRVKSKTVKA